MSSLIRKVSFWAALAGLLGLAGYLAQSHARMNSPDPLPPLAPPGKPAFTESISASGLVEALGENVNIGSPVSGVVIQVLVHAWDQVEVGQALFVVDDRELRAQLLSLEATVQVQSAVLLRLQKQLARLQILDKARVIAAEELETKQSDIAVVEAQLEAARSVVAQTRLLLERFTIRAPIAGTVLATNIHGGEYVAAVTNRPPIVLGNMSEMQVRADIDEQLASLIQSGRDGAGYVKGDGANRIPLHFVRIEPLVLPKTSLTGNSDERVDTRTLQVIYRFNRGKVPVYVGQQMDVFIDTSSSQETIGR